MKELKDFEIVKTAYQANPYWVRNTKTKKVYKAFFTEYRAQNYIDRQCIKHCPYCKTKDQIEIKKVHYIAGHGEGYDRWEFVCYNCNAIIFTAPASNFYSDEEMTKQEAITKYNTRYQPGNRNK